MNLLGRLAANSGLVSVSSLSSSESMSSNNCLKAPPPTSFSISH